MINIQKNLIKKYPELQKKSQIIEYYVSFQYPEKQRKLLTWWEGMIDDAVRGSDEVYLTLADLQIIFSLHGLKPIPLQKVLENLAAQQKIELQSQSLPSKEKQRGNGWFGSIANSIWKFGKSGSTSTCQQLKQNTKVFPKKYQNQQLEKIKNVIQRQLQHERSISYDYIYRILKKQLTLSTQSIQSLLDNLQKKNWLIIDSVQNKKVLFHSSDHQQSQSKKWLQIQKGKYTLKSTIQLFDTKIQQKLKWQCIKLQQAKQCVQTDKNNAKRLLGQARAMRKNTQQLQNRRKLLLQTLNQLQMSQINETTIDVMGPVMEILKDKNMEMTISQKQLNQQLEYLANLNQNQIQEEANNLMAQLEKQVMEKKKGKLGKVGQEINYYLQHQNETQMNMN